jgi:hypothetical protein
MKVKKEYLVLLTVIIILALYLALRPTGNNLGGLPQPAALDSAALNRLVITDKEDTALELVKKDARWFIEPHGYLGDTAKVKNMLKAISDLTLTALVSESGNYERYGLAPNEKKSVQALSNGDTLRAFDIGRTAPTQQHTFVLLAGDPNVYHARGQIARTFDHTVEGLRDKTVFDFDKADVTAITLQQGGRSMTLTQQAHAEPGEATEPRDPDRTALTEWRDAAGRTLDQDAVNRLIDGMARMDCDAYMDDQASERDYAQDQLGDIVFVELPESGPHSSKARNSAPVESVKAVSELYMPLAGEVVAVNGALEDQPELVNSEPYKAAGC